MSRRVFQLAGTLVLLLAALTPLAECFDRWDKDPGPANDTEIHLTAWFAGVGFVLTLTNLLRYVPTLTRSRAARSHSSHIATALCQGEKAPPAPTGSPPLIPLRI
jgi:hypothetical protein